MRAGGAGIPGFYTKTGVGTQVAEGKEVKEFDGEDYILERGIRADLSIIKGWKADESGNLMFRKTARNFNLPAATCGKVCVAEVEEIVPVGSLDPDCIHLPSIYVKRLILGAPYDKKIEFRTVRQREAHEPSKRDRSWRGPLGGRVHEVARLWVTDRAGSTIWVDASILKDPRSFGYLLADAIRQAAFAYSKVYGSDQEDVLRGIVNGLVEELGDELDRADRPQGRPN